MASLLSLSINVNKIDKDRLFDGKKGKYLDLTIAINDELDDFGNNVSCWQGQTKDEVAAKARKTYLGNGRVFWGNGKVSPELAPAPAPAPEYSTSRGNEDENLPF